MELPEERDLGVVSLTRAKVKQTAGTTIMTDVVNGLRFAFIGLFQIIFAWVQAILLSICPRFLRKQFLYKNVTGKVVLITGGGECDRKIFHITACLAYSLLKEV